MELQRWRLKRGIPLNLQPAHFPTSPELADLCAVALQEQHGSVAEFMYYVFRSIWVNELDIAQEDVLSDVLETIGEVPEEILSIAKSDRIKEIYRQNGELALEQGVIGSPCYVLKGEVFWGQDRLEFLEEALQVDREGITPI